MNNQRYILEITDTKLGKASSMTVDDLKELDEKMYGHKETKLKVFIDMFARNAKSVEIAQKGE